MADAPPAPSHVVSVQERIESSDVGRVLISAGIVLLLVAMLALNLPSSQLRAWFTTVGRPVAQVTSLEQAWTVFAPDPRQIWLEASATIRYADGTESRWNGIDAGDPFLDQYRSHHWLKWMEWIAQDPFRSLWTPAATWIAREHALPGKRPVSVTLVRRYRPIARPGQPEQPAVTQEYFTRRITADDLAGRYRP